MPPSVEEEPQGIVEEQAPTTERVSLRKRAKSKTLSIPTNLSDAQKIVKAPVIVETDKQEKELDESQKRNTPFSAEKLQEQINQIVLEYEKNGLHHEALLLKEPFDFDEQLITVKISNEALEGTFDRMRGELLERLRNHLENDHLQIRSVTVDVEKKDMLYTDKEKFEHLKKKYPALKDLQEKFGLDPEF